jgi:lysophospholipase-3
VLVPGYTCSNLDARLTDEYQPPPGMPWCGAMKGKGWFRLWKN